MMHDVVRALLSHASQNCRLFPSPSPTVRTRSHRVHCACSLASLNTRRIGLMSVVTYASRLSATATISPFFSTLESTSTSPQASSGTVRCGLYLPSQFIFAYTRMSLNKKNYA